MVAYLFDLKMTLQRRACSFIWPRGEEKKSEISQGEVGPNIGRVD